MTGTHILTDRETYRLTHTHKHSDTHTHTHKHTHTQRETERQTQKNSNENISPQRFRGDVSICVSVIVILKSKQLLGNIINTFRIQTWFPCCVYFYANKLKYFSGFFFFFLHFFHQL